MKNLQQGSKNEDVAWSQEELPDWYLVQGTPYVMEYMQLTVNSTSLRAVLKTIE